MMGEQLVLGIETSCDETGVALYATRRGLLGQALHSQTALHQPYGGIVPEIASRDHQRRLLPLTQKVLHEAAVSLEEVDAIAYTAGPGLVGCLLIGAAFAEGLGYARNIPVLPVHHLEGHLLSPLLSPEPPTFPFLALLVSGAHTQLIVVHGLGHYRLLGETLDDALGEAFDKSARLLGLEYPGGPALEKLAAQCTHQGAGCKFHLPRPMLKHDNFDFSFAGLKTAVALQAHRESLSPSDRADLAWEFQQAVLEVLVHKTSMAMAKTGLTQVVMAGGVAANKTLRSGLQEALAKRQGKLHVPAFDLCTDNGAMIALVGALRLAQGDAPPPGAHQFSVVPRWPLEEVAAIPSPRRTTRSVVST